MTRTDDLAVEQLQLALQRQRAYRRDLRIRRAARAAVVATVYGPGVLLAGWGSMLIAGAANPTAGVGYPAAVIAIAVCVLAVHGCEAIWRFVRDGAL